MNPLKDLLWKATNFTAFPGFYFIFFEPITTEIGSFRIRPITKFLGIFHLHKIAYRQPAWKFKVLKSLAGRPDFRLTVTQFNVEHNFVVNQIVLLSKDLSDQKSYYEQLSMLSNQECILVYQVHSRVDGSLIGTPEDALTLVRNHLRNARAVKVESGIPREKHPRACIAQRVVNDVFQSWAVFKGRDVKLISATSEDLAHREVAKSLQPPKTTHQR